jgi:hypothetical protein
MASPRGQPEEYDPVILGGGTGSTIAACIQSCVTQFSRTLEALIPPFSSPASVHRRAEAEVLSAA